MTNENVLDEAVSIDAVDYDNNVYEALIVAEDETVDLAAIKIEKEIDLNV